MFCNHCGATLSDTDQCCPKCKKSVPQIVAEPSIPATSVVVPKNAKPLPYTFGAFYAWVQMIGGALLVCINTVALFYGEQHAFGFLGLGLLIFITGYGLWKKREWALWILLVLTVAEFAVYVENPKRHALASAAVTSAIVTIYYWRRKVQFS